MHGCVLNKLMAVATYRAEVERAAVEGREVDIEAADAFLEKDRIQMANGAENSLRALEN